VSGLQAGSVAQYVLYRGAAQAAVRTDYGSNLTEGPTLSLPGFAKNHLCRGLVAICSDRDVDVSISTPAGFAARQSIIGGSFALKTVDLLAPATYTDNAVVAFSGLQGASNWAQHGYLLELL